eukprot:bmy_13684T0
MCRWQQGQSFASTEAHQKMSLTRALDTVYQYQVEQKHWTLLKFDIFSFLPAIGPSHVYHSKACEVYI